MNKNIGYVFFAALVASALTACAGRVSLPTTPDDAVNAKSLAQEGALNFSVSSVAELVAFDPAFSTFVYLESYYSSLDTNVQDIACDGSGFFRYDPASAIAIDHGIIFGSDSGGRWIREHTTAGKVNLDWFGAINTHIGEDVPPWVAATNNVALADAMADSAIVEVPHGNYNFSETIYIPNQTSIQGTGTNRGSLSRFMCNSNFVGYCMINDYSVLPQTVYKSWDIQDMYLNGKERVEWIVVATGWNENCGVFNSSLSYSTKGFIWVRNKDNNRCLNWTIDGVEMWFDSSHSVFTGILVDQVRARPVIKNATILTTAITVAEPSAVLDSIVADGVGCAPNTVGTVGILIGTGYQGISLRDIHFEHLSVGICAWGDNSYLISNIDSNPHGESMCSLAVGSAASILRCTGLRAGIGTGYYIYNENAGSDVAAVNNVIIDSGFGYVNEYFWARRNGIIEKINGMDLVDGLFMTPSESGEFYHGISAEGLYAIYELEDTPDGTTNNVILDYSGNGNNATSHFSEITKEVCALGGSETNYIALTPPQGAYTIAMDVKCDYPPMDGNLVFFSEASGENPQTGSYLSWDGNLGSRVVDGAYKSDIFAWEGSFDFKSNEWQTIVFRMDDITSGYASFIDGDLIKSGTHTTNRVAKTEMYIGARESTLISAAFDVRDIVIFDEALPDWKCELLSRGVRVRNVAK